MIFGTAARAPGLLDATSKSAVTLTIQFALALALYVGGILVLGRQARPGPAPARPARAPRARLGGLAGRVLGFVFWAAARRRFWG